MPGLNQPELGNHVNLPIDALVGDGDGEESSDLPNQLRQPVMQHNMQQNLQLGYTTRTDDQFLDRQVPGTSQANYSIHLPLQPLQIQPTSQPLQVPTAPPVYPQNISNTNHQPQYSTNFFSHHLPPSSQVESNHNMSLQHNTQFHSKPDTYGVWERSLELSPISRTSTATDRIQLTVQKSPGASSNRDTGHNLSFNSDKHQQVGFCISCVLGVIFFILNKLNKLMQQRTIF
jgi:hypothetical protein